MLKRVFLLVGFLFLISSAYAIKVQNIPYHNPNYIGGYGGYATGDSIIINGYMYEDGVFNEKLYREKLAHEIAHVLCFKWTKDYYCNDKNWIIEHKEYDKNLR